MNDLEMVPNQPDLLGAAAGRDFPAYWTLLSDLDRRTYLAFPRGLAASARKHQRDHSTEINREIIVALRAWIVRNDADDWKRAVICGFYWIPDGIALNTSYRSMTCSRTSETPRFRPPATTGQRSRSSCRC
jgi:hypothetical protein